MQRGSNVTELESPRTKREFCVLPRFSGETTLISEKSLAGSDILIIWKLHFDHVYFLSNYCMNKSDKCVERKKKDPLFKAFF